MLIRATAAFVFRSSARSYGLGKRFSAVATDFASLSYRELQREAKERGLRATGKNDELLERLIASLSPSTPSAVPINPSPLSMNSSPLQADKKSGLIDTSVKAPGPSLKPPGPKLNFLDFTATELDELLSSWGQPTYRSKQVRANAATVSANAANAATVSGVGVGGR